MNNTEHSGEIKFKSGISFPAREPDDFILDFSGEIIYFNQDTEEDERAGEIFGSIIQFSKCEYYGFSFDDALDASAAIESASSVLWDFDKNIFKNNITGGGFYNGDVLLIKLVYLFPAFTGYEFCFTVFDQTIEHWTRCHYGIDFVVIEAKPIQFVESIINDASFYKLMEFGNYSKDKYKAVNKLIKYYSKYGFNGINYSNYMYKNISELWRF